MALTTKNDASGSVLPNSLIVQQGGQFLIQSSGSSCFEPASIPDSNNYNITSFAKSLYEHETLEGCAVTQAPLQLGIPGLLSLRTFGKVAYINVISNRTFNQNNGTDFAIGTASSG